MSGPPTTSRSECSGEAAAGELRVAALGYIATGSPVLPLAGKVPRTRHGLREASTDAGLVSAWWQEWPRANIGLRCDGLLVIDVDGEAGERSLDWLQERLGALPVTREQLSGRGRHLFFAAPPVGNSTARLGRPDGIDLRSGSRGYVVAAPSLHASGRRYQLVNDVQPEQLPPGWLERLARPQRLVCPPPAGRSTAYGRAALRSELERLLGARQGERNARLNASVFRLAQLVGAGCLDRGELEREALVVAGLLGLGEHESERTVRSALAAGEGEPRWLAVVR